MDNSARKPRKDTINESLPLQKSPKAIPGHLPINSECQYGKSQPHRKRTYQKLPLSTQLRPTVAVKGSSNCERVHKWVTLGTGQTSVACVSVGGAAGLIYWRMLDSLEGLNGISQRRHRGCWESETVDSVCACSRSCMCWTVCVKKQWCNGEICLERLQSLTVLTHSRVTYSFGPAIFILTTCL